MNKVEKTVLYAFCLLVAVAFGFLTYGGPETEKILSVASELFDFLK